ncbi:putative aminohydrolase SsnA [bacterium]|nr:putative aminohydrolase SsnA [bacterium]
MLVLRNGRLAGLWPVTVANGQDIVIEHDLVLEVGPGLAEKYAQAERIELDGKLVMPGLVCAHDHFYSRLARGMLAAIGPTPDFVSVLKNLWWRLDRALDRDIVTACVQIGVIEAIQAGTTAVIDHHASPACIEGSLSLIREVCEQFGLRSILCYEVTDRYGPEKTEEALQESLTFARQIMRATETGPDPILTEVAIGAHAPFTLSDQTLRRLAEIVSETDRGLHIHVAEDRFDVSDSHYRYGLGPLERLEQHGLLNERTICIHGVHLSNEELSRLNRANAFLVHNARSNMNNGIGYRDRLTTVKNSALGTDGLDADMLTELKMCYLKNRDEAGDFSPETAVQLLQRGNVLLERYFRRPFGRIAPGYVADLVCFNYHEPTPLEQANLAGHILFGLTSAEVDTVLINGRIVFRNGCFDFDVRPYYEQARHTAARLWSAMNALPTLNDQYPSR